jgi:hypothetical protein
MADPHLKEHAVKLSTYMDVGSLGNDGRGPAAADAMAKCLAGLSDAFAVLGVSLEAAQC